MYQTVIESCNGRTAVDILGRSYFVAGSAPVVPGKKIWTDGKIIYGNIAAGSSSYIPVTGDLIYVNHARELFVISGFQARRIGCAKNIIIGSRGNEFAILVDGKGYMCGAQKKADEYTLCAAVLENGDFMSVSVNPEDCMTECHQKSIWYPGKMPVMMSFRALWDGLNYGADLRRSKYVSKPLILHIGKGKKITIDYTEEYMAEDSSATRSFAEANLPKEPQWLERAYCYTYYAPLEASVVVCDCVCSQQGITLLLKVANKVTATARAVAYKQQNTYIYDKDGVLLTILCKRIDGHGQQEWKEQIKEGIPDHSKDEKGQWENGYGSMYTPISHSAIYRCIYDWDGRKLKSERIYSEASITGSTHESSAQKNKIFKNTHSCTIDGYEVIYKYSLSKNGANIYKTVTVQFDDFLWDSGLNLYVASIRKHRNIYYVVVRNPSSSNEFSHAVIAVDSEKAVIIEELKEGVDWDLESFVYNNYPAAVYRMYESEKYYYETGKISFHKCAPSTMFIPYVKKSVRNQIQEVDEN